MATKYQDNYTLKKNGRRLTRKEEEVEGNSSMRVEEDKEKTRNENKDGKKSGRSQTKDLDVD